MRTLPLLLLMSTSALAQGLPHPARKVQVTNTVATEARFVGQTETLACALDSSTLDELNEPQCPPLSMGHMGVDGTVTLVPPSADSGRTRLLMVNHGSAGFLSCRTGPSAGFTAPECTTPAAGVVEDGALVYPGASLSLDITSSTLLRCIDCTAGGVPSGATVTVSYLELSCL